MTGDDPEQSLDGQNFAAWRDYAYRLRVTRIVLGMTEKEAAAAHGVTLKTYLKWEDGRPPRSGKPYLAFVEKYDVNLDWLIVGETANIGSHLSKGAPGKVALLQVNGPFYRSMRPSKSEHGQPTCQLHEMPTARTVTSAKNRGPRSAFFHDVS